MADNEQDLNEEVQVEVQDSDVITVPIDATLTNSGEAADAKAVGDALALKADKSEIQTAVKVNGQSADNQGLIIVTANDTPMSSSDQTTVKARIEAVDGKTGADIKTTSAAGAPTIAQAIETAGGRTAAQIAMSSTDSTTVKEKIDTQTQELAALELVVEGLDEKNASEIKYQAGSNETIKQHVDTLEGEVVKSVNEHEPDEGGNVVLSRVPYADNIFTDEMEQVDGSFLSRTTGGSLGVSGVNAWILRMMGNRVHTGYVEEEITLTVIPMPRPTPAAITATLDKDTFEAYVEEAGTYSITYGSSGWSHTPSDYGITVSNDPVVGDEISVVWDGENDPVMTVDAVPRTAPPAITATIDRDTFVAYVESSTTIVLTYTTEWSADPALYGITVKNAPVAGDQIKVVYVKEVRGTITQAQPTALVATGWNLYNHTAGYARVVKYSNSYGYRIDGTYTSIAFAETPTGTTTSITPDSDGKFNVTKDGYIIVTGGNATNTCIYPVWSDWGSGHEGSWEAYTEDSVSLSAIMTAAFPYGLCKVGEVRDEIDFNQMQAIRRIDRVAYNEANLAAAQASGRAYEYDENYIYTVRETAAVSEITGDMAYDCNDHGMEWFTGTTIEIYTEILYGQNLKDKLRRDVLTVREQSWTSDQKAQARQNIGLGDAATKSVQNDLARTTEGAVLDARQGKAIADLMGTVPSGQTLQGQITSNNQAIAKEQEAIAIVCDGNTHVNIAKDQYVYIKNHATLAEGLYTATAAIGANNNPAGSVQAVSGGGLNSLNSNIANYTPKKIEIELDINGSKTLTFNDWYAGVLFARASNSTGYFYALVSGYGTESIRNNNIVLSNTAILTIEYPEGGCKMKITNTLNQSLQVGLMLAIGDVPTVS